VRINSKNFVESVAVAEVCTVQMLLLLLLCCVCVCVCVCVTAQGPVEQCRAAGQSRVGQTTWPAETEWSRADGSAQFLWRTEASEGNS